MSIIPNTPNRSVLLGPTLFLLLGGCMSDIAASDMEAADFPTDSEPVSEDGGIGDTAVNDEFVPQNVSEKSLAPSAYPDTEAVQSTASCDSETERSYWVSGPAAAAAGPTLAREALRNGIVPRTPVRDAEFLTYYLGPGVPEALPSDDDIVVSLMSVSVPGETPDRLLLSAHARPLSATERQPLNLVIAIDNSASMRGAAEARARAACHAAVSQLEEGDFVAVLSWNEEVEIHYGSAPATDRDEDLRDACDAATRPVEKTTDIHTGLAAAYEAIEINAAANRTNRILILSDGGATAGVSDMEMIADRATAALAPPIFLSTVGVSGNPSQYNESLMRMLAEMGKGRHYYADTDEEARRIVETRVLPNLEIAASEVRYRITFPPGFSKPEESENDASAPSDAASDETSDLFFGGAHRLLLSAPPCDKTAAATGTFTFSMVFTPAGEIEPRWISTQLNYAESQSADSSQGLEKAVTVRMYAAVLRALQAGDSNEAARRIAEAETQIAEGSSSFQDDGDIEEIAEMLRIAESLK